MLLNNVRADLLRGSRSPIIFLLTELGLKSKHSLIFPGVVVQGTVPVKQKIVKLFPVSLVAFSASADGQLVVSSCVLDVVLAVIPF